MFSPIVCAPSHGSVTGLRGVVSAIACSIAIVAMPSTSDASCNLIPVARSVYGSDMGGVVSPVTVPGREVIVALNACDGSPGFEPVAADNDVEIRFEPPTGIMTSVFAIGDDTDDCTLPGGRCNVLKFTVPASVATTPPPRGLAGPARIYVRDVANALVAEIGELNLPTLGCDDVGEPVFEQFTVLPTPNNFEALDGGAPEILATVDGSGSLLVPLDYWGDGTSSVLADIPGSPLAIFLRGSASVPANGAGDTQTIADVIGAQSNPSSFARSFTLDGRPLPPLLRIAGNGEVFGTADAVESVLRFARNDGAGGPNLFDLSDRLENDVGPIVISVFDTDISDPVPLTGLRSSNTSVAYARDESRGPIDLNLDSDMTDFVVQIVDGENGQVTNTGLAMALTVGSLLQAQLQVSIDTEGDIVGFLESEFSQNQDENSDGDLDDDLLHVFDRLGNELTAGVPATDRLASTDLLVDGKPLAVSGDRVFFRTPGNTSQNLEDGVNGLDGIGGLADAVLSPDGKHLYAIGTNDDALVVFERDAVTGMLSVVETLAVAFDPIDGLGPGVSGGGALAISPEGAHVYVRANNPVNTVTVFTRNVSTGELTFLEEHEQGVASVDGLDGFGPVRVSPDGFHVYVSSRIDVFDPGASPPARFSRAT